jgi:ribose transport system permease protein
MTTGLTDSEPAASEPGGSRLDQIADESWRERLRYLVRARETGILVAAVGIFLILAIVEPAFLSQSNLLNVVRQISLLGIVAVGMTYVFISGELDLSVGSMYGLLAMVMAYLSIREGLSPLVAAALVVALGTTIGLFNGLVTTQFRIPSFIVTLGMLSVLRGTALLVGGGMPISGLQEPGFTRMTSGYFFGIVPAQVFWLGAVMLAGGWVLANTRFGYNVYATGGNTRAAAAVGIKTARIKTAAFMLTGALAGLAAVILVGWLRGTSPLTGQGFELDVIAAVIIGGTNLFGGAGSVFGTFLGAAIIGMISNGLVLLGVSAFWEPVVKGGIIIAAVLLDVTIRRRES